jgi:ppGpp synthetase/RelA/SpoT-type nucleotidyltranferase
MQSPSKSEIDRLGDRLRIEVSPQDLRTLDAYRSSFAASYLEVLKTVRQLAGVAVSGRPAKSTTAIVDKLNRESIRLTQMQDIAGCRVVVASIAEQNALVEAITSHFAQSRVFDRRQFASHGYRAVHVVVCLSGQMVEVQVRTQLQHLWGEISEKLADKFGVALKYGGGKADIRESLDLFSEYVDLLEVLEVGSASNAIKSDIVEKGKVTVRNALLELLTTSGADDDFPN